MSRPRPQDERDGRGARWTVSGRVQGVGFRWFVRQSAERHGLRGDVRNLPDGRVEIRARGEAAALEAFLEEVRRGPRGARVESVERHPLEPERAFGEFSIRG